MLAGHRGLRASNRGLRAGQGNRNRDSPILGATSLPFRRSLHLVLEPHQVVIDRVLLRGGCLRPVHAIPQRLFNCCATRGAVSGGGRTC